MYDPVPEQDPVVAVGDQLSRFVREFDSGEISMRDFVLRVRRAAVVLENVPTLLEMQGIPADEVATLKSTVGEMLRDIRQYLEED